MLLSGDPAPRVGLNAVSVGRGCVLTVCGVSCFIGERQPQQETEDGAKNGAEA